MHVHRICLAPEMRSLIDKVFSVNVVAVRSQTVAYVSLMPRRKVRGSAHECYPKLAASPISCTRTIKAVRILCVSFSSYYL